MIKDIAIGFLTGIASSLIVSLFFQRWLNHRDWKNQVETDKQSLCNYIKQLLNELMIYEQTHTPDDVLRLIEREPRRTTFANLNDSDSALLADFQQIQKDISRFCIENYGQNSFSLENQQRLVNWESKLVCYTNQVLLIQPLRKKNKHTSKHRAHSGKSKKKEK